MPEIAGAVGFAALFIVALIFTALSPAAPSKAELKAMADKAKSAAEKAKDKATSAATTGAEQLKDGAQKRATRSSTTAQ